MPVNRSKWLAEHLALSIRLESGLRGKLAAHLGGVYRDAANNYDDAGSVGLAIIMRFHVETLTRLLSEHYRVVIPVYGRFVSAMIRARRKKASDDDLPDFNTLNQQYIAEHALDQAVTIAETSYDTVRAVISAGVAEGMGAREIARNIMQSGATLARYRAKAIAITETHNAAMYASDETARQTGLDLKKQWLATEDSRVRPTHAAANRQTVGMDEKFKIGGALMKYPGDPNGPAHEVINCRCTVAYIEREDDFLDENTGDDYT